MLNNQHNRGFTLVELMVSIGLFAIVSTLATGAYLVMINVSREAQATTTGTNNLSYALELMTRNIRTGQAYNCLNQNPSDEFRFVNSSGNQVTYKKVGSSITETVDGSDLAITSPAVTIETLQFTCSGTEPLEEFGGGFGDDVQANVRINITGTVSAGPNRDREFYMQTLAVMRASDL